MDEPKKKRLLISENSGKRSMERVMPDKYLTPGEQWTLFLWLLQPENKTEPGQEKELFATLMNYTAEEATAAIEEAEGRGFTGSQRI
jgi:hypothetical protein